MELHEQNAQLRREAIASVGSFNDFWQGGSTGIGETEAVTQYSQLLIDARMTGVLPDVQVLVVPDQGFSHIPPQQTRWS